jgi:hypothetical protein
VAAVIGLTGASLWAVGLLEREGVAAQERLFTLQFAATGDDVQAAPWWLAMAGRLPFARDRRARAAEQQAAAQYWLREYDGLTKTIDKPGAVAALDPATLILAAHAAYRRIPPDASGSDTIRRLSAVVDLYAEVLKRQPERIEAAFNFEFVARRRNALAGGNGRDKSPATPIPGGRSVHGDRGAEPPGLQESEFKVIVPKRSDERQEEREAGGSPPRPRKG